MFEIHTYIWGVHVYIWGVHVVHLGCSCLARFYDYPAGLCATLLPNVYDRDGFALLGECVPSQGPTHPQKSVGGLLSSVTGLRYRAAQLNAYSRGIGTVRAPELGLSWAPPPLGTGSLDPLESRMYWVFP